MKPIRSKLGWSTADRIVVRGKDLPGEILGLDWRAVGLVGHLPEESRQPMAESIWHLVEEQATGHISKT